MELLIKCIALALVAMLAAIIVKRYVPEISVVVILIACGAVFMLSGTVIETALSFVKELATLAGVEDELLSPVLKVSAVAILSRMGSDLCKENGIASVATLIELCASAIAIVISIPLLKTALELIIRM